VTIHFPKKISFDVSYSAFFKLAVIVLAGALLFLVREVLLMMFIAIVIASALDPLVDWMQKHGIPRALGVICVYLILILGVGGALALIVPALASEIKSLGNVLPEYLEDLSVYLESISGVSAAQSLQDLSDFISSLSSQLDAAIVSVYEVIKSFFGSVFSVVAVFVLSFYFLLQENAFKKFIQSFVPKKYRKQSISVTERIQEQMGNWLRGQLFLGLVIGVVTYIVLSLLGVKYALVLAIFAGLLEIVPYVGPVIAAVPAIFLGLLQSPFIGLLVFIAYVLIQQFENHLLVPKVMEKAVGLNPLVVIIVILAGAKVAQVPGAIVAVPAATAASVVLGDYFTEQREKEKKAEKQKKKEKKK
jgi:predicted PurR-regulated permease PerM